MLYRNMSAMRVVIGQITGIHLSRIEGMRHYFEMAGVPNEKFAGRRILSVLYPVVRDDVGNLVRIGINMFNRISHTRCDSLARADDNGRFYPESADSDWLEAEPRHLFDVPFLIDSECKKIHTLAAGAGVHEDLVPLA